MTNLYTACPSWLQHAHTRLNRVVRAAHGCEDLGLATVAKDTILARLLALNLERSVN